MQSNTRKLIDSNMCENNTSDDTDSDVSMSDTSDDDTNSDTSNCESENKNNAEESSSGKSVAYARAGGSTEILDENAEDDEVVKAIIKSKEIHRNHPPSIEMEDFIVDISFHPTTDMIAVASITGDVFMYKYNNEETTLASTLEVHLKACRAVEFSCDGTTLFSTAKDLCIMLTDVETEKLTRLYEEAHQQPVYTMAILDEHIFATGDDIGTVKLWDLRQKGDLPIFSLKEMEDYVSSMISNRDMKYLVCSSGDGYLTTINIPGKKIHIQSEEYEEELTSLGLLKTDTKLLTTTSKGKMYVYNWGEFGYHSDEFPGVTKKSINCMIPITENIVITGGEDGILRATSLFPHRHLGIVGQHNFPIESLDVNHDGTLIASSSYNNDIKFWNVKYFETLNINESRKGGKRKQLKHNLPSSKMNNASDFFANL